MPPPPSDDGAAATASAGLGWRVFGRIWQDLGAEQKRAEPLMDDLLYPEQAVDGVVHAEGMGRLRAPAHDPKGRRVARGAHGTARAGDMRSARWRMTSALSTPGR